VSPGAPDSSDLEVVCRTHKGVVRERNEDCYLSLDLRDSPMARFGIGFLVAVADGLGGHAAGSTASRIATECLREVMTGPAASRVKSREDAAAFLGRTFQEANRRVYEAGSASASLRGMGTTLVAALLGGRAAEICNVGDSRAYVLRDGNGLQQITVDHSWAAEYARLFPAEAAEIAGASNLLTRALGPQSDVEVDTFHERIQAGEVLLLCSDGLTKMIPKDEIKNTIAVAGSMGAAADDLVRIAIERGGEDNITVVLARESRKPHDACK